MTPYKFKGYGPTAPDITVILERITHWYHIDPNGNVGTKIELDTGKSFNVGHYHAEVAQIVWTHTQQHGAGLPK